MNVRASENFAQLNKEMFYRAGKRVTVFLSLFVVLGVFWCLKLTGITLAGEAFCGMEEHCHGDSCLTGELICGQDETSGHTHSESCILRQLICELEEGSSSHTHDVSCLYRELICTKTEQIGHVHNNSCHTQILICTEEEREGHSHTDECFTQTLICTNGEENEHVHLSECYETVQSCGMEESEGHLHNENCYSLGEEFICGLEEAEEHIHNEECFVLHENEFICGMEENAGHSHTAECYSIGIGFGCGETEAESHVHTEECVTDETELMCREEYAPAHVHTEECYETLTECPLEEHTHVASCYSDINADLETADDWEYSLRDVVAGNSTAETLVAVARSQLGYTESILNFEVDLHGVRRGITRYGQWYGNPYGDWSAMFVSFCLTYAGVEDLPANAGAESMRLEWKAAELYKPAQEYSPQLGNLVFLDIAVEEQEVSAIELTDGSVAAVKNEENEMLQQPSANAVGIIASVSEDSITVIQGDLGDAVAEATYGFDDPAILGYGLVPEVSRYAALVEAPEAAEVIAKTVAYEQSIFSETGCFVVYTENNGNYYAFDGIGNAVQIYLDEDGNILSDTSDPDSLLWTFSGSNGTYTIKNLSSGRYMHAYPNNGTGVTTSGAYSSTLIETGSGVKIRSNTEYAKLNEAEGLFQMTQSQADAAVYYFGVTSRYTVWLDGTDGGLGYLTGSPNTSYTVRMGGILQLPSEWTSPAKYSYKLRGWYDVTDARYYLPGEKMEVTGNAVLYADWVASTYDIGVFNAKVADTVSTNSFITTHMFDYNYLLNLHSVKAQATVSASGHSETWSMVTSGSVAHGNQETLDFIFIDNDSGGLLCMPNNRSSHNIYPGSGIVTPGIYSSSLGELLFSTDNCFNPATGEGILGKNYLGTGDHLFQIMSDPSDEHYGYYYYDSKRNAASYNQSNCRFYVYEYLEATSDAIGSTNSDFLPLNSPYANSNGKTVGSYDYKGVDGEYVGVPHYRYDSKYNSGNYNSVNNVQTDYAYGMRTDIKFYLPNEPGTDGNKDLYGNDMQFQFSGDDDLWILIDGQLVLDIGGIHGAEDGVIDFSTGQVIVQGEQQTSLMDLGITSGDHTLSVLYLERGASLSNCSIYFNLAPRFGLEITKEDVLTQDLLDGTQFTVYEDFECTLPVELWESESAYNLDVVDGVADQSQSTFTVMGGVAKIWGFGSGNTYYIKETGAPSADGYGIADGVIRVTIQRDGQTTYHVDVVADADGNEPSNGFTVHGVKIDEETQIVYLVVTNAPETVTETTTVQVLKKWEDSSDHSSDYITAYLTVTDPDGTVRRIREIVLSDENGWTYTWTNLPKYDYEALSEVQYGIEESYESGYYSTVRLITEIELSKIEWAEAASFVNGDSYILKNSNGYLSTTSASDTKLKWVDKDTAQNTPLALWTATVSSGKVKLTNGAGQILTFNYSSSSQSRYFYAATGNATYQNFTAVDAGSGFRFYATRSYRNYYMGALNSSTGRTSVTTTASSGIILTPLKKITQTDIQEVQDWAYQITNTPLSADNETAVTVNKVWNIPEGYDSTLYQEYSVTVRLLANGINTGRTLTLNLKNNWQGSFLGLPYADQSGNVIQYAVEELWEKEKWMTSYGEILASGGSPPEYSVVITNTYHAGGPELPSTGSPARLMYVLCGTCIMLGSLVYGIGSRRKRERRMK